MSTDIMKKGSPISEAEAKTVLGMIQNDAKLARSKPAVFVGSNLEPFLRAAFLQRNGRKPCIVTCASGEDIWSDPPRKAKGSESKVPGLVHEMGRELEDFLSPAIKRSLLGAGRPAMLLRSVSVGLPADFLPASTATFVQAADHARASLAPLEPLLAELQARVPATMGAPAAPDGQPTGTVPALVPDAVLCGLLEFLVHSPRGNHGSGDRGYALKEPLPAVEAAWRPSATGAVLRSSPPDFSRDLQNALARAHPWLTADGLIEGLADEAEDFAAAKVPAHRSITSLAYFSPALTVLKAVVEASLAKGTGSLADPAPRFLAVALARYVLHMNDPDSFALVPTPITKDDSAPLSVHSLVPDPSAGKGVAKSVRMVDGAARAASGKTVAPAAARASRLGSAVTLNHARGRRQGGARNEDYARPGTEALEAVTLLALTLGAHPGLADAIRACAPSVSAGVPLPPPAVALQGAVAPGWAEPLASPEFNRPSPGALPPLHRALEPGLFDFFRIHIRGTPSPSSIVVSRFRAVVGAWITHLTPWRSRRRSLPSGGKQASSLPTPPRAYLDVDTAAVDLGRALRGTRIGRTARGETIYPSIATSPYFVRAVLGVVVGRAQSALPAGVRQWVRFLGGASSLLTLPAAFFAADRLLSNRRRHSEWRRVVAMCPPLPGSVALHDDEDDDPACAEARRAFCDGRGSKWAAERSVEFSDFPRVRLRGTDGPSAPVQVDSRGRMGRFVWADAVQRRRMEGIYQAAEDPYQAWEPYVVQHFHTTVHPLHCLLVRLQRLPMTLSPHDGRLETLLDVVDFLDDQVAETLWLCSDLALRQALSSERGAATLEQQGVSPDDHDRLRRPGRRYAALPVRRRDATDPAHPAEVAPADARHLEAMLEAGRAAVCLSEETATGRVCHSMYHCRPAALALCRVLRDRIEEVKRHVAIYGDVFGMKALSELVDVCDQVAQLSRDERKRASWTRIVQAETAQWVKRSSEYLTTTWIGLLNRVSVGTGPGLRYAGPNLGRLQYALLRLITVFELDEKDIFVPEEVAGPDEGPFASVVGTARRLLARRGRSSAASSSGRSVSIGALDPQARAEQLERMNRSALHGRGDDDAVLSPGHPSHRALAHTELAFARDLTQRLCFAGAWASQMVVPRDYDVFDEDEGRQVTARRVLAVGAAARRRAAAASDAVLYRRSLVGHRMVPNHLRPLADVRVLGVLALLALLMCSVLGVGAGSAAAWGAFAIGAAWLMLPSLPAHYRVSNLASLPRDLEVEVVRAASTGPLGADFTLDADHVDLDWAGSARTGEGDDYDFEGADSQREEAIGRTVDEHARPA